tara:strand:+ start:419 stop:946 length:528 start_codon:yes stop_codon:yes gene_type:complete
MIISKHKESSIRQNYFFIKGNLSDINTKYFIDKIEQGIREESALNGKTNVKGNMTSYQYFNSDPEFFNLTHLFMNYIDKNISINPYGIQDSWGLKETFGHYTQNHNHFGSLWSGVVYLSNANQPLVFTDIKEEVEAKIGNFAIFTSILNHETKNRVFKNETKYALSFNFAELSSH